MATLLHGIGPFPGDGGLTALAAYDFPGLGEQRAGAGGVTAIAATRDGKAIFLCREERTLAYLPTRVGIPAYYPLVPAPLPDRVRAVLMDLDGTSVRSERFWVYVIERVVARLLGDAGFRFTAADLPYVSGFSVSEHLEYCLRAYCAGVADATLARAVDLYHAITDEEMDAIAAGRGRQEAFTPAPGLKDVLLNLKSRGVKLGLVTSGLHRKAWPEILSAFRALGLGDPLAFYDSIVTAGVAIGRGQAGTLGELQAKPHPWLYAEALLPLGVPPEEAIGIEDSGAGVLAVRLAGVAAVGVADGNIVAGGAAPLCAAMAPDLRTVWERVLAARV
ncbi:MAG TPA: HAD family phosphatase [Armatimonadota bacterium]|nr:HAD family phosphatase [Armatimonadota bacterium]